MRAQICGTDEYGTATETKVGVKLSMSSTKLTKGARGGCIAHGIDDEVQQASRGDLQVCTLAGWVKGR
jgi:hypothetical protein